MTNAGAGLAVVVAHVGIVLLSIPLVLVTYLLAPRRASFAAALRQVLAVVGVAALALFGVAVVAISPTGALLLAVAALGLGLLLVGFPVVISRRLVERWTGCSPDEGLEFATLGLPVTLLASAVLLVVPGGPSRYTLAVPGGPVAAIAWTALVAVVSLGPAVAGTGLYRLFQRL